MPIKKLLFGLSLLIGILLPSFASAEESSNKISCIDDYYNFVIGVRPESVRLDGVKDFIRGYCQVQDIIRINDELGTLREQFFSASMECGDTSSYEKKYIELMMEQDFVRHVQETKSDVINEDEEEAQKAALEIKLEKLKTRMRNLWVLQENKVDDEILDQYFENWTSKYEEELDNYIACPEGPWADLTDKWQNLLETIKKIKFEVKKTTYVPPVEKESGFKGRVSENILEYFKKDKDARVEKLEEAPTIEETVANSTSFSNVYDTLRAGAQIYDFEYESADRMARYKIMYGEGGARVSSDFVDIVKSMNSTLLNSSTIEMKSIEKLSSGISKKQCVL